MLVRSLSQYTWVSAAQYIQWLELRVGLEEVNLTAIWSMQVKPKTGFPGLLSRKKRLHSTIQANWDKLWDFYQENQALTPEEKGIIQSFLGNLQAAIDGIVEQMETVEKIVSWEQEHIKLEYVNTEKDSLSF